MSAADRRQLTRAAKAWLAGNPHRAWEIIQAHDPRLWRPFQAGMLEHARDNYIQRMGLRNV